VNGKDFDEVVKLIAREDPRYDARAYHFVRDGLQFTLERVLKAEKRQQPRHLSGEELCHGLKDFALREYGPMAKTLFDEWGVKQTLDFGEIVFNLVEFQVFGRTEEDQKEDFASRFDFTEVFETPFRPQKDWEQLQGKDAL